LLFIFI